MGAAHLGSRQIRASRIHLQHYGGLIHLVQVDDSKYPFRDQPPTYIRAQLYKYWFTEAESDGTLPQKWWRRRQIEQFYPLVFLGDPKLEDELARHGLKDKPPLKRPPDALLPSWLQRVREHLRPYSGPAVIWSLYLSAAAVGILRGLGARLPAGGVPGGGRHKPSRPADAVADPGGGGDQPGGEKNGQLRRKEEKGRAAGEPPSNGLRHTKKKK
ncbi:lipase maturation factor 2 [Crotalus adamanteus]|uniref:Lipase maturation factor 2 n=1 Tax=Crotalus adamanteus TaxID=8729 RepID=A0AAW1BF45_CROAD